MDKRIVGESSFVRKPVTSSNAPKEFYNRIKNYNDCLSNYFGLYFTTEQLEKQLSQIHIESMCQKERLDIIEFAKRTGLGYDNVIPENTI